MLDWALHFVAVCGASRQVCQVSRRAIREKHKSSGCWIWSSKAKPPSGKTVETSWWSWKTMQTCNASCWCSGREDVQGRTATKHWRGITLKYYFLLKRSVHCVGRVSRDTNRNIKRLMAYFLPYDYLAYINSLGFFYLFSVSLWRRANARNVRPYYPYWRYTDLFIFRFVSLLCLRSTLPPPLEKFYIRPCYKTGVTPVTFSENLQDRGYCTPVTLSENFSLSSSCVGFEAPWWLRTIIDSLFVWPAG